MKKIIFLVLASIVLFLGFQFLDFLIFSKDSSLENIPETNITYNDEVREINPMFRKVIESYLVTLPELIWQTEEGSSNICVFENLDSEKQLFPLSLWVYCSEYIISEDGEIEKLSGSSLALLLDYPNEFSFFNPELFTFKIPRDGAGYTDSIKEIFSENVQVKIFGYNDVEELEIEMSEKIRSLNEPSVIK